MRRKGRVGFALVPKRRRDGVRERYWVRVNPKAVRTRPRIAGKTSVLRKVSLNRFRRGVVDEKFYVLADLSAKLKSKPILVGGSAVDFYLKRPPMSYDLDLIITNRGEFIRLLEDSGYKKEGRLWYKGGVAVDIVSSDIKGKRVSTKMLPATNKTLRVVSVEDVIIDRLCACKFWKSTYDCESAEFLLDSYKRKLDMRYLKERAEYEEVTDVLGKMMVK